MADTTETNIQIEEDEDEVDNLLNKTIDGFDTTFNGDGDINDDDINKLFSIKRRTGTRANKNYDVIKQALEDFSIPKLSRDINTYRRYFLDIIINGNFRVKYIPSCASRESAENYCRKRLDEDGTPSYRLLPPNAADPNHVAITDINGDKVDDVVIVDRMGFPIIVNGYKLVRASPYKKVYLSTHQTKESRKAEPFNEWVEKQMGKMTIDQIDELENKIDWRSGKRLDIAPSETMQKYIDHYTDIGLGKPRVKKTITPNGLFATAFSRVWKYFWNYTNFKALKKLTSFINFLKVCNTTFLIMIEIPYARTNFGTSPKDYLKYLNAKKGPKKGEINEYLGKKVVSIIKNGVQNIFKETGKLNDNVDIDNFTKDTKDLIKFIYNIAFGWGLKQDMQSYDNLYDANNKLIGPKALINTILAENEIKEMMKERVSSSERKHFKDIINDRINQSIDIVYLGNRGTYQTIIEQGKQKRAKREAVYEEKYKLRPFNDDDDDNLSI